MNYGKPYVFCISLEREKLTDMEMTEMSAATEMPAQTAPEKKKGVTGTTLKIIAIVAMLIDHTAAILLEHYITSVTPTAFISVEAQKAWFRENPSVAIMEIVYIVMRLIGRFGFPLFAFLIVEGFRHTRSVKKYALNLGVFALLSELPFNLGFASKLFYVNYQNVFFTLLFGLLCITCMHYFDETKKDCEKLRPLFYLAVVLSGPYMAYMVIKDSNLGYLIRSLAKVQNLLYYVMGAAAVICTILFLLLGRKWDTARRNTFTGIILSLVVFCALGDLFKTDYGAGGVLTIAILYMLRKRKKLAFSMACLELTIFSVSEFTAFLMLIPVALYNGKRGAKINKYVFYAFYPVHIGLLFLLTLLLGFTTFTIR